MDALRLKHELEHREAMINLDVAKARGLAKVEAEKFGKIMRAIGTETIVALARAGPELQIKMLRALGLEGYLVTDGTSPINLFNTAKGLAATAAA
jgi:major vault protein